MRSAIEADHRALYNNSSILSFFTDPTVQRHWAEYADGGKGYGLVFDFATPWPLKIFPDKPDLQCVPFPVEYSPHREFPAIELSIAPVNPSTAFDEIKRALLTKSVDWSHQREQRLIRVGIPAGPVLFPSGSLRAVLLGYSIETVHRTQLLELAGVRVPPLPVFEMKRGAASYALELHPVA